MKYKFSLLQKCQSLFSKKNKNKIFHVVVCWISYLGPLAQNLMKFLANVRFKFLSWNMANTLIFFAEKMWVAFALTFLQPKY